MPFLRRAVKAAFLSFRHTLHNFNRSSVVRNYSTLLHTLPDPSSTEIQVQMPTSVGQLEFIYNLVVVLKAVNFTEPMWQLLEEYRGTRHIGTAYYGTSLQSSTLSSNAVAILLY